jgi:hypothetical protein
MVGLMNKYGTLARDHWSRVAPIRYAALPSPEEFFQDLGEQVLSQVDDLSRQIAGADPVGETYLEKVGRLTMAKRQAEEIVLADLVWIEGEMSEDEAREEWEATRPMDSSLSDWAWQMQDYPDDQQPLTVDMEDLAAEWALPVSFIEELLASRSPTAFLTEHSEMLKQSADLRYRRFQEKQAE